MPAMKHDGPHPWGDHDEVEKWYERLVASECSRRSYRKEFESLLEINRELKRENDSLREAMHSIDLIVDGALWPQYDREDNS